MKIIVTGGTGFIGRNLVSRLAVANHEIVCLTRGPSGAPHAGRDSVRYEKWDGKTVGAWGSHVNGAHAIFNLAGESIGAKRWSPEQKRKIIGSRVDAARAIVESIRQARQKPSVLVNASAVGYYGSVEEGDVIESHKRGEGFLAETVEMWEREARAAESLGVRVVLMRNGVVLGRDGGALARMLLPFKLFVGGTIGSGRQWFPWVHLDDVVGVALFALENARLFGPVNVTAPDPVTMKQFCHTLGKAINRPSWAPVPSFVLRLMLGEMSEMILTGQRVVPSALTREGFTFRFPKLETALRDSVA